MDTFIDLYRARLGLQNATFTRIDHDEAMVAIVYKVTLPTSSELILKICTRPHDYLREFYFLNHFAGKIAVPRLVDLVQPEEDLPGAILMECLSGRLLQKSDLTEMLAAECGSLLATIHLSREEGYGDLIAKDTLDPDPRPSFSSKFNEGFHECGDKLPEKLLEQCRHYFDSHIDLLAEVDGPCIVHRDFRPGNIMLFQGKLQGIIDWSSGRASFAEEDFCSLEQGEWVDHLKNAFHSGYKVIRPLPNYNQIMPLLQLNKAIASIGFTIKRGTWENRHAAFYQSNRHFLETFLRQEYS